MSKCYLVSLHILAGDGIVVRGEAYGVRSIRVDGNDTLALYSTVRAAREMAIREQRPILVEVEGQLLCHFWTFFGFTLKFLLQFQCFFWSFSHQALTYRVGHHSTSDDSTKYRPVDEIELWRSARDPIARFRKWIESNGWWSGEAESELRSNVRKQVKLVCLNWNKVAETLNRTTMSKFAYVFQVNELSAT